MGGGGRINYSTNSKLCINTGLSLVLIWTRWTFNGPMRNRGLYNRYIFFWWDRERQRERETERDKEKERDRKTESNREREREWASGRKIDRRERYNLFIVKIVIFKMRKRKKTREGEINESDFFYSVSWRFEPTSPA